MKLFPNMSESNGGGTLAGYLVRGGAKAAADFILKGL